MAKLLAIAYKTVKRGPMQEVFCAKVTQLRGVENDVFGRPGKRQITLLSQAQWQLACADIDANLPWITRRANLLIEGISFNATHVGQFIQIGELTLEITGETDPCQKMNLAHPHLEAALTPDWRGGVTCRVISDGLIQQGDNVMLLSNISVKPLSK